MAIKPNKCMGVRDKPKVSPRFMFPNTPLRISGIRSRAVGDDTALDPCARQQIEGRSRTASLAPSPTPSLALARTQNPIFRCIG